MNRDTTRRGALFGVSAAAALLALAGCGSDSGTAHPVNQMAAQSTATTSEPQIIDCPGGKHEVRPARMTLACADAGAVVDGIVWRSWGPDTAQGDGTEHDVVCEPNCANGHEVSGPVHITLTDLVQPANLFTKVTTVDAHGKSQSWPLTER